MKSKWIIIYNSREYFYSFNYFTWVGYFMFICKIKFSWNLALNYLTTQLSIIFPLFLYYHNFIINLFLFFYWSILSLLQILSISVFYDKLIKLRNDKQKEFSLKIRFLSNKVNNRKKIIRETTENNFLLSVKITLN